MVSRFLAHPTLHASAAPTPTLRGFPFVLPYSTNGAISSSWPGPPPRRDALLHSDGQEAFRCSARANTTAGPTQTPAHFIALDGSGHSLAPFEHSPAQQLEEPSCCFLPPLAPSLIPVIPFSVEPCNSGARLQQSSMALLVPVAPSTPAIAAASSAEFLTNSFACQEPNHQSPLGLCTSPSCLLIDVASTPANLAIENALLAFVIPPLSSAIACNPDGLMQQRSLPSDSLDTFGQSLGHREHSLMLPSPASHHSHVRATSAYRKSTADHLKSLTNQSVQHARATTALMHQSLQRIVAQRAQASCSWPFELCVSTDTLQQAPNHHGLSVPHAHQSRAAFASTSLESYDPATATRQPSLTLPSPLDTGFKPPARTVSPLTIPALVKVLMDLVTSVLLYASEHHNHIIQHTLRHEEHASLPVVKSLISMAASSYLFSSHPSALDHHYLWACAVHSAFQTRPSSSGPILQASQDKCPKQVSTWASLALKPLLSISSILTHTFNLVASFCELHGQSATCTEDEQHIAHSKYVPDWDNPKSYILGSLPQPFHLFLFLDDGVFWQGHPSAVPSYVQVLAITDTFFVLFLRPTSMCPFPYDPGVFTSCFSHLEGGNQTYNFKVRKAILEQLSKLNQSDLSNNLMMPLLCNQVDEQYHITNPP